MRAPGAWLWAATPYNTRGKITVRGWPGGPASGPCKSAPAGPIVQMSEALLGYRFALTWLLTADTTRAHLTTGGERRRETERTTVQSPGRA